MTSGPAAGQRRLPAGPGLDGAAPWSMPPDLADTIVRTLFQVGLHLRHALPAADDRSGQHLQAALDDVDRLVRAIRDAAFTARVHPRFEPDGLRPAAAPPQPVTLTEVPPDTAMELRRLLHTSDLLYPRLQRVALALTLSQEAAAELLDQVAVHRTSPDGELGTLARHARAVAAECREFAERLDDLRPPGETVGGEAETG